ncbi:MAG: hypothetical protein AB8E15_08155 [Bdellovibrionales bacterium]
MNFAFILFLTLNLISQIAWPQNQSPKNNEFLKLVYKPGDRSLKSYVFSGPDSRAEIANQKFISEMIWLDDKLDAKEISYDKHQIMLQAEKYGYAYQIDLALNETIINVLKELGKSLAVENQIVKIRTIATGDQVWSLENKKWVKEPTKNRKPNYIINRQERSITVGLSVNSSPFSLEIGQRSFQEMLDVLVPLKREPPEHRLKYAQAIDAVGPIRTVKPFIIYKGMSIQIDLASFLLSEIVNRTLIASMNNSKKYSVIEIWNRHLLESTKKDLKITSYEIHDPIQKISKMLSEASTKQFGNLNSPGECNSKY